MIDSDHFCRTCLIKMKIRPAGWRVTVFRRFRAREKRCRQCRWSVSVCLNPCSISVWPRPGLFPPVSSYRSGSVALQKHLNLRWQECVQLISSTVAPSSVSVLPNAEAPQENTPPRRCPGPPCLLPGSVGALLLSCWQCVLREVCPPSHLLPHISAPFLPCWSVFCLLSELNRLMAARGREDGKHPGWAANLYLYIRRYIQVQSRCSCFGRKQDIFCLWGADIL